MSASAHEIAAASSARREPEPLPDRQRSRLVEALEAAQAFYMARRSSSWVPEYLDGRQLEIPEAGYAPGGWSTTLEALRAQGFIDDELAAAGLVTESRRGTLVDRFRSRLMLPIRDASGDLVGFVGRVREGAKGAKYLNSPASALYDKSAVLMGLAEGVEALQAGAVATFVEGPLDRYAVTGATAGAAVGLATGGTALTAAHIAPLGEVVDLRSHPIAYATDDDEAGVRAAAKGWELLAAAGADPERVRRPLLRGHDPASLQTAEGADALAAAVLDESAPLLVDVYADAVLARWSRHMDNALARIDGLREVARLVSGQVDDEETVTAVMGRLASRHELVDATEAAEALADVRAGVAAPSEPPESEPESAGATVVDLFAARVAGDGTGRPGGGGGGGAGGGDGDRPESWTTVTVRDRFENSGRGVFKLKYEPSKKQVTRTELLPVSVYVAARVVEQLPDDADREVTHVDLIARRGDEEHRMPAVTWKSWEACSWVPLLPWPAEFDDTTAGRSRLRKAIISTSEAPLEPAYGALGWHKINDEWCYVHAGGVLGAQGPVEGVRVNLFSQLKEFALPVPPSTTDELRDAVLWSTSILDAMPTRLAAPMLGAVYRAVLGSCPVTLMPVGPPGGGKTSIAALAAQHYAPSARYNRLPGAGGGEDATTVAALEEMRYRAGDVLFPIDDLAPDRGVQRASQRAAAIARSQFNGYGKGRRTKELDMRETHPPRGLPMVTGEESTSVESAESRTVLLRVTRGDIDVRTTMPMMDLNGAPEARARLIAAMVKHYAPSMPMDEWTRTRVATLRNELIDPAAVDANTDVRRAESLAELAAGWEAMLNMAVDRGALSEEERRDLWERAWSGLVECKRHLMAGTASRTPADRVRELLRSALVRGEVSIATLNGGTPEDADRYGWEQLAIGKADLVDGWRMSGTKVGWTDGTKVWLEPGAVFPALKRQADYEADPLTWSRRGLGDALADMEVIATRTMKNGVRRTTVSRWAENSSHNVWEFDHAFLFPPAEPDDEPDASQQPAPPPIASPPTPTAAPEPAPSEPVAAAEPLPEPARTEPPEQDPKPSQGDSGRAGVVEHPRTAALRRRGAAAEMFGAIAAVCEPGKAWLARRDAEPELCKPPEDADLAALLDGMVKIRLGHVDGRGRYRAAPRAWGQVWITTELRKRLGWQASLDGSAAKERKVAKDLRAAGWTLVGKVGYWMRVQRGDDRLNLVVPDWMKHETSMQEWSVDAPTLARRLGRFATATGKAWQWAAPPTGQQLAAVTRPALIRRGPQPLPAVVGKDREKPFNWTRQPTADEERMKYAHRYDFTALYRTAATSLDLAWGEYEHIKDPDQLADALASRPGYVRAAFPKWTHALLPDPIAVEFRGQRETLWVTTPTLRLASNLLEWDIEPLEAWLAVETLSGTYRGKGKKVPAGEDGSKGYGRLLDKWAEELKRGAESLHVTTNRDDPERYDPDDAAVLDGIKACWAHGVGQFNNKNYRPKKKGERSHHPLWRPDFRHAIIAQSRYAIMSHVLEAAEAGIYPLAIQTDAVIYASDDPDWESSAPPGFNPGREGGQVWPPDTARMEDYAVREGGKVRWNNGAFQKGRLAVEGGDDG